MYIVCTLYAKAADALTAFNAASQIVVGYASGSSEVRQVELEGAKSALAYSVVEATATKLDAAVAAWESQYEGKRVDYDRWLLAEVAKVTAEDVLHVVRKYIVALFDPIANVVFTCPTSKSAAIVTEMEKRSDDVRAVPEEKLCSVFGGSDVLLSTTVPPGGSRMLPGDFARQFKCGCAKCVR